MMLKSNYDRVTVIPCFNEEFRLNIPRIIEVVEICKSCIIFIDDGSQDATFEILDYICSIKPEIIVIRNAENLGKAESLKVGFDLAINSGFKYIGTYDADNSISPNDLLMAFNLIESNPSYKVTSGARLNLAGSNVKRNNFRKWMGRIVATIVSYSIRLTIYDPQSPCKVYRSDVLSNIFKDFFLGGGKIRTKWFFDAEILKMLNKSSDFEEAWLKEFPILYWRDEIGSNISIRNWFYILLDIFKLVKH